MKPKDHDEIVASARMCGARSGDIITLDDGSRWKLVGRNLVAVS